MAIEFIVLVNKQGQTRLAVYQKFRPINERTALEAEVVRKCLGRKDEQCNFIEYMDHKLVYKRYASLFFIVGIDKNENEMAILEFIHCLVETFDRYFENVCELDVMFNLEKAHFILQEMLNNGQIVETNKNNVLEPIQVMDKFAS